MQRCRTVSRARRTCSQRNSSVFSVGSRLFRWPGRNHHSDVPRRVAGPMHRLEFHDRGRCAEPVAPCEPCEGRGHHFPVSPRRPTMLTDRCQAVLIIGPVSGEPSVQDAFGHAELDGDRSRDLVGLHELDGALATFPETKNPDRVVHSVICDSRRARLSVKDGHPTPQLQS